MSRQQRKVDHLHLATSDPAASGFRTRDVFADVVLVHNALPELALDDVDLRTHLAGVSLPLPVYINAMTGGVEEARAINRDLARLAARHRLAMAVGSQRAALEDAALRETYQVVRQEHPAGPLIANLGAGATSAEVEAAVAIIAADLVQIHLNPAQELIMPEGDRDFRGQLARLAEVRAAAPVPVIVKEVGFGLTQEVIRRLYREAGIRLMDVSGRGGTNFAHIEAHRDGRGLDPGLAAWGHPTPFVLGEAVTLGLEGLQVLASGGIAYGSQAAKALAMGAAAVGVAGALLQVLMRDGFGAADAWLQGFLTDLKRAVLLTGARTLAELRQKPVVILGATAEWLTRRGVDVDRFSRRGPGKN